MANYGDDVLKNVMEENLKKEAEAYGSLSDTERASLEFAALVAIGPAESVKLIKVATDAGCGDTLRKYANYMFMAGFSKGYEKGRISMLEDAK